MNWSEIISIVLNALLGGGIVVTIATLRATRNKAKAEAEQADATSTNTILKINQEYIVEPLQKEINALRNNIKSLTKALNRISDCPHSDVCPVRDELRKQQDTD